METIGVLQVPKDVLARNGATEYNKDAIPDNLLQFRDLSELQGTKKLILPVHTLEEHRLWRELTDRHPDFLSSQPHWSKAERVWNSYANTNSNIYDKVRLSMPDDDCVVSEHLSNAQLPEQLKLHFAKWKRNLNVKETLAATSDTRRELDKALWRELRLSGVPSLLARSIQPHQVARGFMHPEPVQSNGSTAPGIGRAPGLPATRSSGSLLASKQTTTVNSEANIPILSSLPSNPSSLRGAPGPEPTDDDNNNGSPVESLTPTVPSTSQLPSHPSPNPRTTLAQPAPLFQAFNPDLTPLSTTMTVFRPTGVAPEMSVLA